MPLFLRGDDIAKVLTYPVVLEALERSLRQEAAGAVTMPSRMNIHNPSGWIRIMPTVIAGDDMPYMGMKVMNLVKGQGTRYLILLYGSRSGELLAIMDAATVTQMRTAGTTALAARHMVEGSCDTLGIFGSGFEARGHVEALAHVLPFQRVLVYSPRAERREQFAREMTQRIGRPVVAAASPEDVAELPVTCLATKATEPVIDGDWLSPGATVLSIGSTRLDLRELDRRSLERAATLVVDHKAQVAAESGDIKDALEAGVIRPEQMVEITDLVVGRARARPRPDAIAILKTVGTALQDVAVAGRVYELARDAGIGADLGDFPVLKAFG